MESVCINTVDVGFSEKGLKKGLTLLGRDGILTKLSDRAAVENGVF